MLHILSCLVTGIQVAAAISATCDFSFTSDIRKESAGLRVDLSEAFLLLIKGWVI